MKVGDRVKVVAEDYKDDTGVVMRVHNSGALTVNLDTEVVYLPFLPHELELIEGE